VPEFGEIVGILGALVGWFEGVFGFHVHTLSDGKDQ
jgi:hypothetical protein